MTSELHEMNTNDTTPPFDGITETPNDSTPPMFDVPPPTNDMTVPTNDVTTPTDDPTPQSNGTAPTCDTTTPPNDRDKAHNSKTRKQSERKIKNKGVVPTKSQRCKKDERQEVLHCAANANPEKLAATMMQQNYWLTDEHIDHAQWLISRQFPTVNGFHSVLAFESQPPKVVKGLKGFVQIINAGGSHWVTVTNIGCEENKIKVYDSLYRQLSAHNKLMLALLLNTTFPNMVIEWPRMQKQEGTSDCGLFATAVAVSLCSGHNPSNQSYDQSVMREHLAMCFMCEELAVFPLSQSNCEVIGRLVEAEELFCHCRMPYTKGQFMIECSRCLGWFHRSCDNVPRAVRSNNIFHCMNCK